MKYLALCSLFAGGLCFAANHPQKMDKNGNPKLSWDERIALETESPRVHLGKHHQAAKIEKNKTTIVAFVPYGK